MQEQQRLAPIWRAQPKGTNAEGNNQNYSIMLRKHGVNFTLH
jgi:hypothetical protein